MSVEGKVVLITGAARGMGREHVRGFLEAGAKVVAADISWVPSGVSGDDYDFAAELAGNPNALLETMDLTLESHVQRVYASAMQRFGTIDVIVNNGGLRQRDLYPPSGASWTLETDISEWQRMFDTHVFGMLRVIKAFSQPMLEMRRGSIINIGSSNWGGQGPSSREMPYKAAKGAVATMTFYLAYELRAHNIAVNLLIPGHTRSTGSDEQEQGRAQIRAREDPSAGALLRLRVKPDHVVPPALHLAAQDASTMTGQEIVAVQWNVDNGLGGLETWGYEPDVAAAHAAGRAV
ncbi:MAG TPA: SDR family oxidoreductase [Dehalococcoidia bacterium]|nr:SDR family oxidoreductase [Dehalococcoidia bacterium]